MCDKIVDRTSVWAVNTHMTPAAFIIDRFGGTRKAAAALGAPVSTVQSWKEAGFIPAKRQAEVLRTARTIGVKIQPEHFFSAPEATA